MKVERGYTLVEAAVTIAIMGFLITVLAMAVQQVVVVPERGGDQVNAIHSVQNAAHWVALDGQMAESATGGSSLIITLPDSTEINYALAGNNLQRSYGGVSRTIAEDVSSVNFTVQGKNIYMTIVATPESRWGVSQNQTYQVYMRPTG
jgi:type II secretory pathway pseudopilin PulG